nr:uncharacterized protein LOC113693097 [Coffea arabica]
MDMIRMKVGMNFSVANLWGSIWVLYKSVFDCQTICESDQHLTLSLRSQLLAEEIYFSFIHSKCTIQEREGLWIELLNDKPEALRLWLKESIGDIFLAIQTAEQMVLEAKIDHDNHPSETSLVALQEARARLKHTLDNEMLTEVPSMQEVKEGGNVMLKLDMMKAYDRVSFFIRVLRRFGFSEVWIDMIWRLISNVWFSVFVNGSPQDFFKSSRDLRQGDLISTALFVIGAEVLSRSLNTLAEYKRFRPFKVPRGCSMVTHLAYADDVVIFTSGLKASITLVKGVVDEYCAFSDQRVNCQKSCYLWLSHSGSHCFLRKGDGKFFVEFDEYGPEISLVKLGELCRPHQEGGIEFIAWQSCYVVRLPQMDLLRRFGYRVHLSVIVVLSQQMTRSFIVHYLCSSAGNYGKRETGLFDGRKVAWTEVANQFTRGARDHTLWGAALCCLRLTRLPC